jgi:hypothetical protein
MIGSKEVNEKTQWILRKPFSAYEQTIEVQAELATAISLALNEFCDAIGDNTDMCDPSNLTPKDIQNLVIIYRHVQSKLVDENK